jgi:sulfite reductase alpha subunit-like flavoprotein
MSRTLNIFTGKKSEYNKLILKSLVVGTKKTIQIAEYIYLNKNGFHLQVNKNEVKSINSIICRKNSRLDELSEKGYIRRENNLWKLEFKGICVTLTLFNDFADVKKFINFKKIDSTFKSIVREAEKHPILALLRTKEANNIIKEQLNRMENDAKFHELFLFKLRAFTSEMILQGVNIDIMSKLDFQLLMANKIFFWMMG